MSSLGIIAALPAEANCLYQDKLSIATPVEIEKDIYLCMSGIGHAAAKESTLKLLELNVDAFISWGIAGAINNNLKSGDLILANKLITEKDEYVISEDWMRKMIEYLTYSAIAYTTVPIFSTNEICASKIDKDKMFSLSGASAIEMESAAVAEIAIKEKKDFLILKAIADEAHDSIPEVVLNHTDLLGRPDLTAFILGCLKKPSQIPSLYRLARCFKQATRTLEEVAANLKKQHFLYN